MTPFAEKSIASVSKKFHAALRNLAVLGFISSDSILGDVRHLVKNAIEDAYIEGLVEGGIPADEMTDEDVDKIIALQEEQAAYVTDFVRAIREAKDDKTAQKNILDTRIEFWTSAIEAAGAQGLASAKANTMGTWHYGDTDHCQTCESLNGQRHRLKWFIEKGYIPRKPGNEQLECKGFNCQCYIVSDNGERLM